jgi:glycosyltransferase involved in cell wall biosynthesis
VRKLSCVIVCYNEEEKIQATLEGLRDVCDEILVVDSFSTDATVEICRQYTERVIQRSWNGYRDQKQYATEQAIHDWVLSLDADEELSQELRAELLQWKESGGNHCNGYFIPRLAFFMGRWIKHTTWYPDWQLRLFRKSCGRWEGGRVHEAFKVHGPKGKFAGHLYHYTYSSISEYLEQLERFSSLAAKDYDDSGKRARVRHLLIDPKLVFFKNYIIRKGFMDGVPGLVVSLLAAASTFFKYLKLWEIQRCNSRTPK